MQGSEDLAAAGGERLRVAVALAAWAVACAGASLLFGGVMPWTWAGAVAVMWLGAAGVGLGGPRGGLDRAVVACMAVVLTLLLLQQIPLPARLLAVVSPRAHQALELALPSSEVPWRAASLDRSGTLEATLKGALYALTFLLARRLGGITWAARAALVVLVAMGCAEVVYALHEQFAGHGRVLWVPRPLGVVAGRASGTFINPNHFAGLLAMAVPVAVVLALPHRRREGPVGLTALQALILAISSSSFPKRVILVFASLVLGVGLAASLSRGGLLAAGIGVCIAMAGVVRLTPERRRALAVVALLALGMAGLASYGMEDVIRRFGRLASDPDLDAGAPGRLAFVRDTLRMTWDHLALGVGAGAWRVVYPTYRSEPPAGLVEFAHCDLVQVFAELGLVGGSALLIGVGRAWWTSWRAVLTQEPERARLACAALAGVAAIAAHSAVDFNLRIPANALWASSLLGLAVGLTGTRPPAVPAPLVGPRWRARATQWLLVSLAAVHAGAAVLLARADWLARPAVARAQPDDRPLGQRLEALERASAAWPYEARHHGARALVRWQLALSEEVRLARAAAASLAATASSEESTQLEVALLAARRRSSPALAEAARLARSEIDAAIALAPGAQDLLAIRSMLEAEAPRRR